MKHGKFETGKPKGGKYSSGKGSGETEKKELQELSPEKNALLYFHDVVYLLAIVLILFSLIFRVVVVSGSSMYDTLIDGDYVLLLSNVIYPNPKYGDVIVASKDSFEDGEPIIKRVIATEGQTVNIDFTAGIVYVDGVALEEDYTYTPTTVQEGVIFPQTVEEGCIFVMGDNRNKSKDSRSLDIGMIDVREVMGKAILIVIPGMENDTREFGRIGAI